MFKVSFLLHSFNNTSQRATRWESSVLWRVLLGQIRQIFLLCVISSPLFSPDSHRRGSVQSKLCYGPGGCPGHVAVSTAALGFIIHYTGHRYSISSHDVKMDTNRSRFQISTESTNDQIKSSMLQLRGENTHFNDMHKAHSIQEELSFLLSVWANLRRRFNLRCLLHHMGPSRVKRLRNSTPTAAQTTCFWNSKPDCSFCVSIWHPALKAGDTVMTISDFPTDKRAAHMFLIFAILKQLHQRSNIPLHDHYLWPNCLKKKIFSTECNPE